MLHLLVLPLVQSLPPCCIALHAIAFAKELESYPELSGCPLIIPVSDLTFEVSMGSGGASLQALVAIVERLSARAGILQQWFHPARPNGIS